ncbi:hypothetical protein SARC_07774 [Sphaeroforma arctica JP610]|uniref:Uncharacterized protein n=1 Tax=Sphaeroforma arctica JP610 TaxID=667725 RepID=A0A0L0FTF1_9EUKA|nr:hypothetical protein SARC_07774 [Sphaeroforma arctica JP610]KNC79851.1 hypothetical protein SARC_07774 [Sphaeroforma arctica JP610]|eukprot:XP_014153753.1 hypothetical protein SARC_07774 [Sphaeroforma arctica JP610]
MAQEVELLIQDHELRAVLLDVARQNYSDDRDLCSNEAGDLNIEWSLRKKVLEFAKDAEAGNSSRNINQSSRPQSWTERMFLPEDGSRSLKLSNLSNKAFSNDALFARVTVERDDHSSQKSLTPKEKGPIFVLPTGVIDVGESDGTAKTSRSIENTYFKRQVSCNESASGALELKPKLFASDNITLDCNNINGSRIISEAEDD